ncbi:efflux RND transporter permease subunit [Homoserinibacter sp. GY 40078]|uniref:efflux RND transporter permease subunit n=1 Tax=Homoserinibacter sp. GY 40078 TaxID=2603275 RepID=UPI0011C76AF4|nr:efflux RND transporter permease subunit [Homoserinibacter sp. GY 40078]TXK18713.1 efflux RND transporter permease subunit [Homoserinibacter sp. GY 40078]
MSLLSVFSLRNRALIALLTVVVALFGGYALTALKLELFPSLTLPNVTIIATYPGASPDVVESDVSTPVESAIQGIEGLESTSATSSAGLSTVQASFSYGTDLTRAEQKVELAVGRIESQLPDSVDPQVVTFSIGDFPVIQLAVTSDLSTADLAGRLENLTVTSLEQIDGVSSATLYGVTGQRITITPDLDELAAAGLTTQSIRDALQANGRLLAAGEIDEDDKTLTVQAGDRIGSVDEIEKLPLIGGAPSTTIGDVSKVEITENPVTGISRVNGEPSLTVAITKTPAGNTVDVSRDVTAQLDDLAAEVGGNTAFTVVFDQAPFIESSIESLATEGLLGLGFAVLVIFVFLLSVRSTLVAAISIPVSVLITFVSMLAVGYTLNVLTLGALTIAIGRVVDDSIVVIENIKRHMGLGEDKRTAVLGGVKEVAVAITASTVTTVAVFLPIALVGDITGELFRPFALTVTIALAASLFVALTIVPVLAYWFLKEKPRHEHDATLADPEHPADELEHPTPLQRGYLPIVRWTVKRPAVTIVAAALVLLGTLALVPYVPTNFVGDSGQNTLSISQSLPAGASLEAKDAAAKELETALGEVDGIETVQVSVGSSGGTSGALAAVFGGSGSTTFSITTDESADQEKLRADVQDVIDGLDPDTVGTVSVSSGSGGGGFSNDIAIEITAPDSDTLATAADDVLAAMKDLDVTQQAESNLSETQPFIEIRVNRADAAEYGLSESAIGGIVAEAMLPSAISSAEIDGNTLSIYIDNPNAPTTIDELRDFEIPTPVGPVELSELAKISEVDGPASISTERGVRTATVSVTPSTADVGTASAEVQAALDELDLPDGVTAELGGVTSDQQESFSQLGLALLAAILIVYTVMVATFRSLRQPLLLLVSVPFAATGAILLQLASGIPLGVASIIGLLMLIGIVVTNAIVLVDLVNQYRGRGMRVDEAIVHGASRRLRPILMTALATIFALIPMAIGLTGHGGFISQPLAIVVIGGLISSTVLTLVVLPSLYSLVEGAKERREARRAAKAQRVEPVASSAE